MSLSELIAAEPEEYRRILLNYSVLPCKTLAIQNPVLRDPNLMISHRLAKKCTESPTCLKFHNYEEKRRRFLDDASSRLLYRAIPCKLFLENFLCNDIDSCVFSHSQNELLYHPSVYKTRDCLLKNCPFERFPSHCPNLHPKEPSRRTIAANYEKFIPELPLTKSSSVSKPLMNLTFFKVNQCQKKAVHNKKICPYYHHDIDKRRPTLQFNYCFEPCPNLTRNFCSCDQNCQFSKNKIEQLYHPEKYKKKFCEHFPNRIQNCEYGDFCSFAHSEQEIRTELFHKEKQDDNFILFKLKTVYCPFKTEHDRSSCPYAHNVQDFRRSPLMYKYEPEECPNWSKGESVTSYDQPGCAKMLDCDKCHGWKEYEYHPQIFRTRPCANGAKCQKKDCAFYHSSKDMRVLDRADTPSLEKPVKDGLNLLESMQPNKAFFESSFQYQKTSSAMNNFTTTNHLTTTNSRNQDNQQFKNLEITLFPNVYSDQIPKRSRPVNESEKKNNSEPQGSCPFLFISKSSVPVITFQNDATVIQNDYFYGSPTRESRNESIISTPENSLLSSANTKKSAEISFQSMMSPEKGSPDRNKKPLKAPKSTQSFVPSAKEKSYNEGGNPNFFGIGSIPSMTQERKRNTELVDHDSSHLQIGFVSYNLNLFSSMSTNFSLGLQSSESKTPTHTQDLFKILQLPVSQASSEDPQRKSLGQNNSSRNNLNSKNFSTLQNDDEVLSMLLNEINNYPDCNTESS